MTEKSEPVVEVWGLEELGGRRLKRFDFAPHLDEGLWAYPVFTSRAGALAFVDTLTEDAMGPDAELFRERSRESVRRINPREIPRAAWVAANTTAVRDPGRAPGDNMATVVEKWGKFYDGLIAETH